MKRKWIICTVLIISLLLVFFVSSSFAIFKKSVPTNNRLTLASWNVHLNQTGVNNSLVVANGLQEASYLLHVYNESQFDVRYSIVISNIPSGVEVAIDDPTDYHAPQSNNTYSAADVGKILYTDSDHENTHTIYFRATSGASFVNNQTVNIDVIVKQIV